MNMFLSLSQRESLKQERRKKQNKPRRKQLLKRGKKAAIYWKRRIT